MYLAELLMRKRALDYEIKEMTKFLTKTLSDGSIDQEGLILMRKAIEKCIDDRQTYLMKIDRANGQVKISIGNSTVNLTDALKIRSAFDSKILVITELIESSKGNVEVMGFIEQRRKLYDDYIVLNNAISIADWNTKID